MQPSCGRPVFPWIINRRNRLMVGGDQQEVTPMAFVSDLLRTLPYAALGAVPGLLWYIQAQSTQSVVIMCLGAFIVGALSHPKVSAANVALGGVGIVASYNAPRFLRSTILDAAFNDAPSHNPEEVLAQILEHANEHGLSDLVPQAQQIVLVSWAEGAADTEALRQYLTELSDAEFETLRTAFKNLRATEIINLFPVSRSASPSNELEALIQDRRGYDLASLCGLLDEPTDEGESDMQAG
jgi:hypothetical protein